MKKFKQYAGTLAVLLAAGPVAASDHLDTRRVVAEPAADIGDLFAWSAADKGQLNLVMTLVGHSLSPRHAYAFHLGSGSRFGETKAETVLLCQPRDEASLSCWLAADDQASGNASHEAGLMSAKGSFRVFAGLRDDPFFNNVKGSRDALNRGIAAVKAGLRKDIAGCPAQEAQASADLLKRWRETDGGPGQNFLAGWQMASLVVSVDLKAVSEGGDMLSVWAATYDVTGQAADGRPLLGRQVDRAGRTLTGNALLGLFADPDSGNDMKDRYNGDQDAGAFWDDFADEIQIALGFYDGLDHVCGNQWLAGTDAARYEPLARLLLDDRLWINSRADRCDQYMAVEFDALAGKGSGFSHNQDCGGRTPLEDAVDIFRSLLVDGTLDGVPDGVAGDDKVPSLTEFPFLAKP